MALKRKPNWLDEERALLVEEYRKRKDILKAKYSRNVTTAMKKRAWEEICDIINTANPNVPRSVKDVQKKWENLCNTAKHELSGKVRPRSSTSGEGIQNSLHLSDISMKVFTIMCEDPTSLSGLDQSRDTNLPDVIDLDPPGQPSVYVDVDPISVSNSGKRSHASDEEENVHVTNKEGNMYLERKSPSNKEGDMYLERNSPSNKGQISEQFQQFKVFKRESLQHHSGPQNIASIDSNATYNAIPCTSENKQESSTSPTVEHSRSFQTRKRLVPIAPKQTPVLIAAKTVTSVHPYSSPHTVDRRSLNPSTAEGPTALLRTPGPSIISLKREVLQLEKEKLKLEMEKLEVEKEKLHMEKNKLNLEISKLKIELQSYGVKVDNSDFE
ncbi:hypothetical protein CHS0354_029229 [Potamilus streckersoni]|nr:hypothetical protein CHS0354_029229 [Potamilus streckersoni]